MLLECLNVVGKTYFYHFTEGQALMWFDRLREIFAMACHHPFNPRFYLLKVSDESNRRGSDEAMPHTSLDLASKRLH